MVAKVVKLAVVPAALGLASLRVYAMTEEKTEGQNAPQELSIYHAEPPVLRYVEEKPGHLQTGLGVMRAGLQPYIRAVQNTCTAVKVGALTSYQAGQDTYDFLRDPPPGFLPRVCVITVSGLAGLILARKGSRLKRIGVPLALTAAGTAVCYPLHTVGALKVTGKKIYAGSSLVASAFKSDIAPDLTPPEAVGVTGVTLAESSPAVDITSDAVEDAENLPELAAPLTEAPPLAVEEGKAPPAKEITTNPQVNEKPKFVPNPALVDHGQANPEDADLYSTRG